jgi:uncharacterized protein with HEPN domain
MTTKDNNVYLKHIIDAIKRIEEYTGSTDSLTFFKTPIIQDGVIRQIEIIGEATKNLSSALRDKYPSIPWQDIAGMRDKLIHDYFGVDIDAVWETVKKDIPNLKVEISSILLKENVS